MDFTPHVSVSSVVGIMSQNDFVPSNMSKLQEGCWSSSEGDRMMICKVYIALSFFIALLCAGCASGDGGQVLSGILTGIGAGL